MGRPRGGGLAAALKRKKKGSKGAGSAKDALVADIKMNSYYDKKYKSEVGDDGLPSWAK